MAEDKSKIALTDLLRLVMMHDHSAAHALHRHWDKLEVSIMGYLQCFDLKAEDSLAGVDYLEMLRRFQEGREALGLARFEVVPYMMRHTGVSEDLAAALRTLRGKKRGRWARDESMARYAHGARLNEQANRLPAARRALAASCLASLPAVLAGSARPLPLAA